MSGYYLGNNIQSFNVNPFLSLVLNKDYSTYQESKYIDAYNTISSIKTAFGEFIIETIINELNIKKGTNYSYKDFGLVNIPIDQNSRCSYLIFPLKTNIDVLIRVYVQRGQQVSIDFNELGFVDKPNYMF